MRRSILVLVVCVAVALSAHGAQRLVGGDAGRGAKLFQDLKCATCHTLRGVGGKVGPDLTAKPGLHDSPNAVAAAMWSHATKMWEAMAKAGVQRPKISQQQAADIVAYIAGKVQADMPGDAKRGQRAYEAKFCASCHDQYSGAPSFAKLGGEASAYWMVAGMWEHGAGMLSRMVAKNTAWQTLSAQEVGDILAYLSSRK
jgi:mono/diheme cytochrome c family protein